MRPNPYFQEMVEVYNGDIYVRKIPLRVLVRFSGTAFVKFRQLAIPVYHNGTDYNAPTNRADAGTSQVCPVADTMTTAEAVSLETTQDIVKELPHASEGEASLHERRTMREQLASLSNPKRFYLDIDAPQYPTHRAVEMALKWMLDNAILPEKGPYIDFGPPWLDRVELLDLLDFYQVALAFEMQPFPMKLKREIMARVSDAAPTLEVIKDFAAYIPVQDTVMVRMITSHYEWDRDDYYTVDEIQQIEWFVRSYLALASKFGEIFRFRTRQSRRTGANSSRPTQTTRQQEITERVNQHEDNLGEASRQEVEPSSPKLQARGGKAHRRRKRRQQQSKGRAEDKADVNVQQ